MDADRFDALVRSLQQPRSRRGALAALLAGLLGPLGRDDAESKRGRGKNRGGDGKKAKRKPNDRVKGSGQGGKAGNNRGGGKRRGDGKDHGRAKNQKRPSAKPAQAEAACFGGTNCAPGPGKNLAKCDFSGSAALKGKNLKGANLGNASLARADASDADLQGANLGGACLVDAKLTGVVMNASTNVADAIRCRTVMPDGRTDNSGCNLGTACCPTCDAAHPCLTGQVCCQGRCRAGDCCSDAQCTNPDKPICLNSRCSPCSSNAQCGAGKICCGGQCRSGNCCSESDCATRSCQSKTCTNNQCRYTPLDGTACADGNPCTTDDACRNGTCVGRPKDCSAQADACNDGVCRAADGQCVKQPKTDGTACSDNDSCTTGDSCQNGVCRPGAGVDCSGLNDVCNDGVCRQSDGQCVKRPKQDGTACGQGRECVAGDCEATCRALQAACDPNDNQCCQDTATSCAKLASRCYNGGTENDRCCRARGAACRGDDCDCCGANTSCLGQKCCGLPGAACGSAGECCDVFSGITCNRSTCCIREGFACEEGENQCCDGSCVEINPDDWVCQPSGSCRSLGRLCQNRDQCCQTGGPVDCDEESPLSSNTICCRPLGGTCSENGDCCNGVACVSGRCCLGEGNTCAASTECCSGFECRDGVCRSNICRQPGESCPSGTTCCPEGGATCSGGTCCQPLGSTCERLPATGDPCCGDAECCGFSDQYCGSGRLETCCYPDFQNFISGPDCTANEQCCSGHCTTQFRRCCRPQGAPCGKIGALNFDCCIHEGLTCSGTNGSCIPCGKLGQPCTRNADGSTCCIGSYCNDNGVCAQDSCGIGGAPCQDASTCCPGSICSAGAVCLKVCQAEGEFCRCFNGSCAPFPCCGGLTCDGNQEKCVPA